MAINDQQSLAQVIENKNYGIYSLPGRDMDALCEYGSKIYVHGNRTKIDEQYMLEVDQNDKIHKTTISNDILDAGYGTDKEGCLVSYRLEQGQQFHDCTLFLTYDNGEEKEHHCSCHKIWALHQGVIYSEKSLAMSTGLIYDLETEQYQHYNYNYDSLMFVMPFQGQMYFGFHSGIKIYNGDETFTTVISSPTDVKLCPSCAVTINNDLYVGTLKGQILVCSTNIDNGKLAVEKQIESCPLESILYLACYEQYLFVLGKNGQLYTYDTINDVWSLVEDLKTWTYGFKSINNMLFYQGVLYVLTDRALHALIFPTTEDNGPSGWKKIANYCHRRNPARTVINFCHEAKERTENAVFHIATGGLGTRSHC